MPRTASSQVQSRSNVKARPSATARAGSLVANTPVLFRLPAIPSAPVQDLAVTFTEAAANLPTATLAAVALSSAQAMETPVETTASESSVMTQAAPQQTWWEHWSSGIVLIVLLIALATASILAWQGSSKGPSKLMADTKNESESSSALSNIEIPKLESPKLELPVSTKANATAGKTETSNNQNSSFGGKSNDDLDSSLIPSGPLSLSFDEPATKEPKKESDSEPEVHATASLQSPVVKQQEPLFKDELQSPTKSNLSAQPASTPSQRNTSSGDKPSVWDSSKSGARETNKPLTLEFSNTDLNASTAPKESTSEPLNASSAGTTASLVSQSSGEGASGAANAESLVPKDMQYAAKTATPEMDQAEYLALYRKFATAQSTASTTKVDNRYEAAATAALQRQTSGIGTSASVVGYTQPAPTQPNAQPQTGNNYTLQPQQAYPSNPSTTQPGIKNSNVPSAATQQNMSQQYPNVQSPNPPYPNIQYSNSPTQNYPQYPNQPFQGQNYSNPPQTPSQFAPQMQGTNTGVGNMGAGNTSLPYGGAQVPYTTQPTAQPSAIQLPPGPIGGYGYSPTPTGTQYSNVGSAANKPTSGTASVPSNSTSYPSLR